MTLKSKRPLNPLAIVLILSGVFFVVFLVISAALFFRSPGKSSAPVGGELFGNGSIGVIDVKGVIMDSKRTLQQLEDFEDNGNVKAIVLRLNSPGGSVAPSQEIYEAVKRIDKKKPVIASMQSVAASGAYYIAAGTRKIFANAGTITGSIGVIMEFVNLEKIYEWAKVKRYTIKTGKFKDSGADYRDMTDEERAYFQAMINDTLRQFKEAVSTGRKIPMGTLDLIADGRIFNGAQAKEQKLVDEIGTFRDAVAFAAQEAKLKVKAEGRPNLVYPGHRGQPRILDYLLDDGRKDEDSSSEAPAPLVTTLLQRVMGVAASAQAPLAPGMYWLWGAGR